MTTLTIILATPSLPTPPGGELFPFESVPGASPPVLNGRSFTSIPSENATDGGDGSSVRDIPSTHALAKRYDACSLSYDNNNYPSTAHYGTTPTTQHADNNDQVTKWIDYGLINTGVPGICSWKMIKYGPRRGTQEYASQSALPLLPGEQEEKKTQSKQY